MLFTNTHLKNHIILILKNVNRTSLKFYVHIKNLLCQGKTI